VGETDLPNLLADSEVVTTGISATTAHAVGLSSVGEGDGYVTADTHLRLVQTYSSSRATTAP